LAATSYPSRGHDIVVIGGSGGGLEGLRPILTDLPADLPAAVFVVIHVGAVSYLTPVLARTAAMTVVQAQSGAAIEPGKVYVAAPGRHLLLHDNHILLRRGPRENLSRPAVDALFRSAAVSFGGRVIGVLLSGALSDGTAGLRAIKRCGGLAVVQQPRDAVVPDMPRSALRHVDVDHVCPAIEIAGILQRLVNDPAGPGFGAPLDVKLEAAIAAQELADMKADDTLGKPSRFTCPECHGALWEIKDGTMLRYRCHVGHAFTADTVLSAQAAEAEKLLEMLQRSHQERAALARRMAERERREKRDGLAERLEIRAREYEEDALLVRELIGTGMARRAAEVSDDEEATGGDAGIES
jgi:two-component system, chemotaxis family, protein-glutamate methylesterase/glutaminase